MFCYLLYLRASSFSCYFSCFPSISACVSPMWLVVNVIAVRTAITTSAVVILAAAQPVAVQHMALSQEHRTATYKVATATAKIT